MRLEGTTLRSESQKKTEVIFTFCLPVVEDVLLGGI